MGPKRKCARETRLQFVANNGVDGCWWYPNLRWYFTSTFLQSGAQKRICRHLSDRPNLQTCELLHCTKFRANLPIFINRLLWFSFFQNCFNICKNTLYLPYLLQMFSLCIRDYNCDYKLNSDAKWTWQLPFNQAHFKQVILLHLTVYCCCFCSYYYCCCCCCCCYSCAFCAFLLTDQFNRLSTKFHRKIIALCTQPANSQKTKNTKKSN